MWGGGGWGRCVGYLIDRFNPQSVSRVPNKYGVASLDCRREQPLTPLIGAGD